MKMERTGKRVLLKDKFGRSMVSSPAVAGEFAEHLIANMPGSISFGESIGGLEERDRATIGEAILRMVVSGMLKVSIEPMRTAKADDTPKASTLARADTAAGHDRTANLLHEPVKVDPAARLLIPLLDGRTDRGVLEDILFEAAMSGRLNFSRDDAKITETNELRALIHDLLPGILQGIAVSGLLEP